MALVNGRHERAAPGSLGRGAATWARCAAILLAASCAGPTTGDGAYRGDAAQSAKALVGIVSTALVAADAERHGQSFPPYTDVTISDAESDASSVQTTFSSRQPPDEASVALQGRVMPEIAHAVDGLQQLRIAERDRDAAATGAAMARLVTARDGLIRIEQETQS
jgi:hypothetical protein